MNEYMAFWKSGIPRGQEGQVLLVVVLTMIVALTVGLSIAARIVTELKLSKQNEESQRAFQAAESGIQQTLARQSSINNPIPLNNNASFSTVFSTDTGASIILNNEQEVDQITGVDVWLSDYSSNQSLLYLNPMGGGNPVDIWLYWGSSGQNACASAPAIEAILLKGPRTSPTIQRNIFEVPTTVCNNRITNPTVGELAGANKPRTPGPSFLYRARLQFGSPLTSLSNGLILRLIPIYNSTIIGLQVTSPSGTVFPPQGSIVTATGTSGDTVRKVNYFQSYPQLPIEIFPYSQISL